VVALFATVFGVGVLALVAAAVWYLLTASQRAAWKRADRDVHRAVVIDELAASVRELERRGCTRPPAP
jgi:hypothetical protein